MLFLLGLNLFNMLRASYSLETVYEAHVVPTFALLEMDRQIKEIRFRLAEHVINQLPAVGNRNQLKEARKEIKQAWDLFKNKNTNRKLQIGENEKTLIAAIDENLFKAESLFDRLDGIYSLYEQEGAFFLLEDEWPYVIHQGLLKPISQLLPIQQGNVKNIYQKNTAQWNSMVMVAVVFSSLFIMALTLLTAKLVSAFTGPLGMAVEITGRIAEGEMDTPIHVQSRDEIGKLLESFSHMRDQVRSRQQRLETILNTAAEGIITFDSTGMIESFNQASEKLFGYHQKEALGKDIGHLILPLDKSKRGEGELGHFLSSDLRNSIKNGDEILGKRKDKTLFPMDLKVSSMVLQEKPLFTVLISNITERKQALEAWEQAKGKLEARVAERTAEIFKTTEKLMAEISERKQVEKALEEQAIRDPLTGLYNRRFYNTRIAEEISRAKRNGKMMAVMICDLDRFKSINETHGHHRGDEVLTAIANIISNSIRGADLAFRLGGDEFIVVLPDGSRDGLLVVAERIQKRVSQLREKDHSEVGMSIGAALYPEHGNDPEELVRLADRALYIAKKGGDKIHIGEEEYRLDDQTIQVVFQPVVEVRLDKVMGYEALSRDPQGKYSILTLFRRYHAIGQLHELKCLCFRLQMKAAQEAGLERLFLNVDFNVLKVLDVPPKPTEMEVVLEISESEALDDVEDHLKVAQKWRNEGYKFAMDDFGAGFISLPFIARLVPDYIKLDRATVLQAVSSVKFKAVLKDLIHALRKTSTDGIIAEGIETKEELAVIRAMGVYMVQGYLFGKPQVLKEASPATAKIDQNI